MSNRTATAKGLDFTLRNALSEVAKRPIGRYGGPYRARTGHLLLAKQALYQMS